MKEPKVCGTVSGNKSCFRWGIVCSFILFVFFSSQLCFAEITGQDVLILVNANSPTSRYIAKLYRMYHPDVPAEQVLELSGLTDCSGLSSTSANEIITRTVYDQYIATPVRQFLLDANHPERITQIKIIITTAGMPYRIEDTTYSNIIYPAGSNADDVISHESSVDAASVESELTCLWYCDYDAGSFDKINRMINPYQGYRNSSVGLFPRLLPGTKQMNWTFAISHLAPLIENPFMEGTLLPPLPPQWQIKYGTVNRNFNAGDMYLTCRLDGPKNQGQSAIFIIRKILERAKKASNPAFGINPDSTIAIFDDAPNCSLGDIDNNRVFNVDGSASCWTYTSDTFQPPNAPTILIKDDYVAGFTDMTYSSVNYSGLNVAFASVAHNTCVILDRRSNIRTSQNDLAAGQLVVLLACYGRNGDENSSKTYLLNGGPAGGALFNLCNGAVFTSLESFNAVTMLSNATTAQAKIIDFISIGGCGAIGHSFEPQPDAAIDNEFLFYNLLADADADGKADLTFIEAAFSAIPYISWSEVVIGDPLMRIAYGTGGQAWSPILGDVNVDGAINIKDAKKFLEVYGGDLCSADPYYFNLYNDAADLNQDGKINIKDSKILAGIMQQ